MPRDYSNLPQDPIVVSIVFTDNSCYLTAFDGRHLTALGGSERPRPLGREQFDLSGRLPGVRSARSQDMRALRSCTVRLNDRYGIITAFAVSLPGELDSERRMLVRADSLHYWVGCDLKQALEDDYGCQAVLGGRSEAAKLAAAVYGHLDAGDDSDAVAALSLLNL